MHSLSQGPNIIIFVLLLINNECIRDAEDSVDGHKTECNTHRRCSFIFRWNTRFFFMKKVISGLLTNQMTETPSDQHPISC